MDPSQFYRAMFQLYVESAKVDPTKFPDELVPFYQALEKCFEHMVERAPVDIFPSSEEDLRHFAADLTFTRQCFKQHIMLEIYETLFSKHMCCPFIYHPDNLSEEQGATFGVDSIVDTLLLEPVEADAAKISAVNRYPERHIIAWKIAPPSKELVIDDGQHVDAFFSWAQRYFITGFNMKTCKDFLLDVSQKIMNTPLMEKNGFVHTLAGARDRDNSEVFFLHWTKTHVYVVPLPPQKIEEGYEKGFRAIVDFPYPVMYLHPTEGIRKYALEFE